MMKNYWLVLLLLLLFFLLSGCTAETHDLSQSFPTEPKGFWWGLWHGLISVVTFVISWFDSSMAIYEVNNNGFWYDFGFLLGIGAFSSSAGRASKKKSNW